MQKTMVLVLALLTTLSASCSMYTPLPTGYNNVPPITTTIIMTTTPLAIVEPAPLPKTVTQTIIRDVNDVTFIYPAAFCFALSDGDTSNFKVQLHNGSDKGQDFSVYADIPIESKIEEGTIPNLPSVDGIYQPAPSDVLIWLTYSNTVFVDSKWTTDANFTLQIPKGYRLPDKWYFLITSKEDGQGAFAVANACTVFVNTR